MINLQEYKNKHPLYTNVPDRILAKKVQEKFYPKADFEKFFTTFKGKETKAPSRGFAEDVAVSGVAGGVDFVETISRAARTLDPEGGRDYVRNAATSLIDWTKQVQRDSPDFFSQSQESKDSYFRRAITGGVRSIVPSVGAGLPGLLAGALTMNPMLMRLGYSATGGAVFGLAEYDRFLEDADSAMREKGIVIPKSVIKSAARKSALVEGGVETLSNYLDTYLLRIGNPLAGSVSNTLKGMMKVSGRVFIERQLKLAASNVVTEMIQEGAEAKLRRDVGIPAPKPWDAATEVAGAALVTSLIFNFGGSAIQSTNRRRLIKTIESDKVAPKKRAEAVKFIDDRLRGMDTKIADAWTRMATESIQKKEKIDLGADLTEAKWLIEAELRKNLSESEGFKDMPKEVKDKVLGKSLVDKVIEAVGDKGLNEDGDKAFIHQFKVTNVTDEKAQLRSIVTDRIKQHVDIASAQARRGNTKEALEARQRVQKESKALYALGDDYLSELVTEALGIAPEDAIKFNSTLRLRAVNAVNALHDVKGKDGSQGSTFNFTTGNMVGTDNYSVAVHPDRELKIQGRKIPGNKLSKFILDNTDLLQRKDRSLGTWYNGDDGYTYIDVVATVSDMAEAMKLARDNKQLAIYDLKTLEEIKVDSEGVTDTAQVSREVPLNPDKVPGVQAWEMTLEEYKKSKKSTVSGLQEYLVKKFKTNNPRNLFKYYQSKYPELGRYVFKVTANKRVLTGKKGIYRGKLVTRVDNLGDVIQGILYLNKAHVNNGMAIVRHEIEHALDKIHRKGAGFTGKNTFDSAAAQPENIFHRFTHSSFEVEYMHRALIKDALLEGKQVPEKALKQYPELQNEVKPQEAGDRAVEPIEVAGFGNIAEMSNIENDTGIVDSVKETLKGERGSLWPGDKEQKFQSEGGIKVEAMLEKSRAALKASRKLASWTEIKKTFMTAFVDRSATVQKELKKAGPAGQEVIVRQDALAGMSAKAAVVVEKFKKQIYGGLTAYKRELLDGFITNTRILTIDKFKKGVKHPEGVVGAEAQAWIADLDVDTKRELQKKADSYFKAMRWVLDNSLKEGLITEADHKRMADVGPYSPREFLEFTDPAHETSIGSKKISVHESGFKAITEGAFGLLNTDSELLLSETIGRHLGRVAQNKAGNAAFNLATEQPSNGVFKIIPYKLGQKYKIPKGMTRVWTRIKGVPKQMIMRDELASQWVTADPLINSAVASYLKWGSGTAILKAMATGLNPEFAVTNFFRDAALVWASDYHHVYSSALPVYLGQLGTDLAQVSRDAIFRKGAYLDMANEGGLQNFLVYQGRVVSRGMPVLNAVQNTVGYLGETSEIIMRLALRNRGLKAGLKPYEATWVARSYLDFTKGGNVAKAIDNVVPYFNASIQGTRSIFRAAKNDLALFSIKMAQVGALSVGLFLLNHFKFPEAEEGTPDYIKRNNFVFYTGTWFIDKSGNKRWDYYKVAKDQGQRLITTVFENGTRAALGLDVNYGDIIKAAEDMLAIMPGSNMPPAFKAILGYAANYDFWRDRAIWRGPDIEPKSLEFTRYTHPFFKDVGKATKMSPERLRYALSQFFTSGNVWTAIAGQGYERLTNQMSEKDRELTNEQIRARMPFMRRFMGVTDPYNKFAESTKEAVLIAKGKRFAVKQEFDKVMFKVLRGEAPKKDVWAFIRLQPSIDRKRLKRRYIVAKKVYRLSDAGWWLDLAQAPAEARAQLYLQRWTQETAEGKARIEKNLKKVPNIRSKAFRRALYFAKKDLQNVK